MNLLGRVQLSRIQIIVSAVLLFIIVILGVKLSSDDNQQKSIHAENEHPQNKTKQSLESSAKPITEDDHSQQPTTSSGKIIEFSTVLSQKSNSADLDPAPNQSFSSLDDESLLNISDVLENSLVATFLNNNETSDQAFEQKAAIDVFVSRLPDGLSDSDFQQINALLRDYLPYDLADSLIHQVEEIYRLNEKEQAYLSTALANNKSPETMAEQIAIAKHLESLKAGGIQQESEHQIEASQEYLAWQKTEAKLEKIESSSTDLQENIHQTISEEYGAEVADDYLELSDIEIKWKEKYAVFLEEKSIISESGLSEEDKAEQIESLIQQHYEESEWAAARGYDEMMQGPPGS